MVYIANGNGENTVYTKERTSTIKLLITRNFSNISLRILLSSLTDQPYNSSRIFKSCTTQVLLNIIPINTIDVFKEIPSTGSIDPGIGYDSVFERARGEGITYSGTSEAVPNVKGRSINYDIVMCTSQKEFEKALGITGAMSLSLGLLESGVNANVDFIKLNAMTDTSICLLIKVEAVRQQPWLIRNVNIKDEALKIYKKNTASFLDRFGDSYVKGYKTGGVFYGAIIIECKSEQHKKETIIGLKGKIHLLVGKISAAADFKSHFSDIVRDSYVSVHAHSLGYTFKKYPNDVVEMLELASIFPKKMEEEKEEAIMKVILDDYHLIGLPRGSPSFVFLNQKRAHTIEKCANMYSSALSKLKTINYHRGHPEMYPDDDIQELTRNEQEFCAFVQKIKEIISRCLDDPNYDPDIENIKEPEMKNISKYIQTTRSSISLKYDLFKLPLGRPKSEELICSDGKGKYALYENGAILSHPEVGTYVVYGPIFTEYNRKGREGGNLGYPTTDQYMLPTGQKFNRFQGGSIYWHESTESFQISLADSPSYIQYGLERHSATFTRKKVEYTHLKQEPTGDWNFGGTTIQPIGKRAIHSLLYQLDTSKDEGADTVKYTVPEGSTVVFDLREFLNSEDNLKSYSFKSCTQTSGMPVTDLKEDPQTISFKAPYLKDDTLYSGLEFKLETATKDKNDNVITHQVTVIVKRVQRAMIFQGGVALGAYEAGVFHALVKKLSEQDKDKGLQKRPLFDIIAGTSIGGMNAAVVLGSIRRGDGWQDAAEKVEEFWKDQEYPWPIAADFLNMNPMYRLWWDTMHNTSKALKRSTIQLLKLYSQNMKWYGNGFANWSLVEPNFWKDSFIDGWYIPGTAEAARRYYSAKQIVVTGAPHAASGWWPWSILGKFFDWTQPDLLENFLPRPDNKHFVLFSLKKTLEHYVDFPIKRNEGQPRFLLVTVDVHTGDAVTFDSYSDDVKYHDDKNTIHNENGIEAEHVLSTGTFPQFFDYPKFKVNNREMGEKDEEHIFWDGGFRSNTPLREVIQAHRDYWYKTRNQKEVPDLEVYIADLWPSELKEEPISFDLDFVKDRQWDILLGDKTDYDEQVANVVTDYVDLVERLRSIAETRAGEEASKEINYILERYASSKNTQGETRQYRELLDGRFRLTKVVRIDHKDDGNDVSKKIFDYSPKTIERLMKDGYQDTLVQMEMQKIKDGVSELAKRSIHGENIEKIKENLSIIKRIEGNIHQIQENLKIENGYDRALNEVRNLIHEVESISLSLKEQKDLVVVATRSFEETIKGNL
jgi:NTE family protein